MSAKTVHRCDRCGIWAIEIARFHGKTLCSACLAEIQKVAERTQGNPIKPDDEPQEPSSSVPSEKD